MTATYPYALPLPRYRELMAQDHTRMRAIAGLARTAAVPAYPDWNGDELVRHTALLYLQKAETVRTGTKPRGRWLPEELRRMDSAELLDVGYARLIEQFDAHDPADPAESWVPGDQTVSFWIRRLAHETAIHRYDLETAVGEAAPIDTELAADGIDEVLTVMLGRGAPDETASGAVVAMESDGKIWCATLEAPAVRITRDRCASPAGRVTGSANDVLLWLWGRAPLPEGSANSSALAELRRRLAAATGIAGSTDGWTTGPQPPALRPDSRVPRVRSARGIGATGSPERAGEMDHAVEVIRRQGAAWVAPRPERILRQPEARSAEDRPQPI